MADVVSPCKGIIEDVSPIPPFRGSCDNVADVDVTAWRRETGLSKVAGDKLLLTAREAPTTLLGASYGQVVVECQVLGPSIKVCGDGCRPS